MTHDEWIYERVAELLRALGKIERDMEGEALVSMACLCIDHGEYRVAVGSAPSPNIDKDVATAYWDAVAKDVPIPEKSPTERARQLEAIRRFEEALGLAPRR